MLRIDVGKQIKQARLRRKYSLETLAEKCGFTSHSALSKLESGKWNASLDVIEKVFNALEMKTFIFYEDARPKKV